MKKQLLALLLTAIVIVPCMFVTRTSDASRISVQLLDIEQKWEETLNSLATSTTSATGYLLGLSVSAYGADVNYTVHFTSGIDLVKTAGEARANPFPQISSSTLRTVRDGDSVNEKIQTIMKDPSVVIHGLSTSATVQVILSYGVPGTK